MSEPNPTPNPVIERYMGSFETALQRFDLREWKEIAADLRSHISEALEYGKPLDEVLQALGPAAALARAYAVELKMNLPSDRRGTVIARFFSILGILAASGLVSFIVVSSLGAIAIGFFGSGLAVLIIGAIEAAGVHLPNVQLGGLHPLAVMALGPPVMLVGLAAGWALWLYVRALVNMLRKTLPRAWSPARAP